MFYYIPLTVLATSSFLLGSLSIIDIFSNIIRRFPRDPVLKTARNSTEISWHQYSEPLGTSVEEESARSDTVGTGCCVLSDRILTPHCVFSQHQTWSFECCKSADWLLGSVSIVPISFHLELDEPELSFRWLSTFVYGYRNAWTRSCTTWLRQKCVKPQSEQLAKLFSAFAATSGACGSAKKLGTRTIERSVVWGLTHWENIGIILKFIKSSSRNCSCFVFSTL